MSASAPAAVGPWKVTILATTTENVDAKPFTVSSQAMPLRKETGMRLYVLSVHYTVPSELLTGDDSPVFSWTVNHRYSDFEAIRAKLTEFSTQVPALPGKTWFGSLSSDVIASRKVGLNTFLHACLERPWIGETREWRDFIGVRGSVPARLIYDWSPVEIKSVRNALSPGSAGATDSYGVNDVVYRAGELVLILGMEEQRLLQKVDNLARSIRMPWDKAPPARPTPLGCIKVHKVDEAGSWKTMCAVSSVAGVVCLAYHEETRTLAAGLDDGAINVYRVHPAYVELELRHELRVHDRQRCTSIAFHHRKQYILSAARDKQLVVHDLRKSLTLSSTLVGGEVGAGAWVSAMEVDEEAERAFLGTYAQHIHIYDIAEPTAPRLLHTLQGHTGSVRCLQYCARERYLFSGGFDAVAGVWSIPSGGNESVTRARSVGWLKDGASSKIKSIVYLPAGPLTNEGAHNGTRGLVVAGHDGGYISIFDVGTGRLRYALKAHGSSVVKLVHLAEANVLISAGLDGVCKFWSIPSRPAPGYDAEDDNAAAAAANSLSNATAALSIAPTPVVAPAAVAAPYAAPVAQPIAQPIASDSSASSSSSLSDAQRRKSSSMATNAPPPTFNAPGTVLHKSSRADSADANIFSSSFADRRHARPSFFEEEDEETVDAESPSHAAAAAGTASASITTTQDSEPTADESVNATSSSDAVEVPTKVEEEEEEDIF